MFDCLSYTVTLFITKSRQQHTYYKAELSSLRTSPSTVLNSDSALPSLSLSLSLSLAAAGLLEASPGYTRSGGHRSVLRLPVLARDPAACRRTDGGRRWVRLAESGGRAGRGSWWEAEGSGGAAGGLD